MTKVTILAGGVSDEREVSLRSAACVERALKESGYLVAMLDTGVVAESQLAADLESADIVFPVLHGKGGEDGSIQKLLEKYSTPYVGADSVVSELCFDKWKYRQAVSEFEIPLAEGALVTKNEFWNSEMAQKPFVLKPYDGGSSVDTFIIRNPSKADETAINTAFKKYERMLLEELIEGQEITVGVLGDEVLPVIEIIPPSDGEFDYENKYNGKSQELCPPQHINKPLQQEAQRIAKLIHTKLGIRDMSRTDIIIRSSDNALFVLETNTIPGMTDQSLLPKAAAAAGYDMQTTVTMLIESALSRTIKP